MADIVTLYGDLLQRLPVALLHPVSSLPASVGELKSALIADAKSFRSTGLNEGIETVRTCYALLSSFVADDVARRGDPGDFAAAHQEMRRLIAEFNLRMEE